MTGLGRLNGLRGCCTHMGAVANYDQIIIGGKAYTVNQILDKMITANADLSAYSRPGGTLLFKVSKGQVIGKVYSYLRPDQTSDGRAWLMFEKTYNNYFYVPADGAASKPLEQQGAKTVEQEIAEEKARQEKANDPVSYYFKKLAMPVLLGGGAIYLAASLGKEYVKGKLSKSAT